MTVPTPTRMASEEARSAFTLSMSSGDDILTCFLDRPASLPSAVMAQFTVTRGRMRTTYANRP